MSEFIFTDEPFRYSDEDWRKIVKELPAGADALSVRAELESLLGGFRPTWPHARLGQLAPPLTLEGEIRERRKVVAAARDFIGSYPRELLPPGQFVSAWQAVVGKVREVAAQQEEILERLRAEKKKGRRPDWYKWVVIEAVLGTWVRAGGSLRRSNSPEKGATGPTVRYLIAASTPKFRQNDWPQLTPEKASDAIRTVDKGRHGEK